MPMQRVPDPYQVLGVSRAATDAQIKAAHRALAKRYHPDASAGDARRFLQIQEAYKLLSDPLRRREWDARHAPGPVRADEPRREQAQRPSPPPRAAASGRQARQAEPAERQPRRSARPARPPQPDPTAPPGSTGAAGTWPASAQADFDVYDRSSGAAWSSAARAYFRRYDADLPRHGSFHHQGTQPLTAARARAAADEEARRRASAAAAAPEPRAGGRPHVVPPPPAAEPRPASRSSARATRVPVPPRRPYAYAGVARDSAQVSMLRALARRAARSAHWPTLGQRLLYALLAWVPLAALIGYGGAAAAGCEVGASTCPPWFVPAQSVATALVLGLLVALPHAAFLAAAGGVAALASGAGGVVVLELFGRRPPLTPAIVGSAAVILAAVYLGTIGFLLLHQRLLPWYVPRRPARPSHPPR